MKINGIVLATVTQVDAFKRFIDELDIRGESFLIKPNWSNANTYTSAKTLDLMFSTLNGDKTVIEGYTAWRNELNTGPVPQDFITPRNAKKKWKWIKDQDEWFLRHSGIGKVLKKHGVEYVNITEEVWPGRVVTKEEIKRLVEADFGSLRNKEMYSFMPEKVYKLRGHALISLNLSRRTREMMSLSTKNLFGLIPDPARYGMWHGENDSLLPQSIVDINKIYRSLFKSCFWINETKERRLLVGSKNSVEADALSARISGVGPKKIEYLRLAAEVFGGYNEAVVEGALNRLESS